VLAKEFVDVHAEDRNPTTNVGDAVVAAAGAVVPKSEAKEDEVWTCAAVGKAVDVRDALAFPRNVDPEDDGLVDACKVARTNVKVEARRATRAWTVEVAAADVDDDAHPSTIWKGDQDPAGERRAQGQAACAPRPRDAAGDLAADPSEDVQDAESSCDALHDLGNPVDDGVLEQVQQERLGRRTRRAVAEPPTRRPSAQGDQHDEVRRGARPRRRHAGAARGPRRALFRFDSRSF